MFLLRFAGGGVRTRTLDQGERLAAVRFGELEERGREVFPDWNAGFSDLICAKNYNYIPNPILRGMAVVGRLVEGKIELCWRRPGKLEQRPVPGPQILS